MSSTLEADLERGLESAEDDFRAVRGARLLITGGTGFVGSWLLESIAWANRRLATDLRAIVLTRDPARFREAAPHLAGAAEFAFARGDVTALPEDLGRFDGVIHAATPASAALNRDRPHEMLDIIYEGGKNVLELAAKSGSIPFLFTSSGAVYGRQPQDSAGVSETYGGAPDCLVPGSAYHEGKRVGELQCTLAAQTTQVQPKIARLFAFVGPYLPLDLHFAIGNFIRDGLRGRPIQVGGDGTALRSYLYATDMTAWLWAIFVRGTTLRAYNVGSPEAIDIGTLARTVAAAFTPEPPVQVARMPRPGAIRDRFVPNVARATGELGLQVRFSLAEGIRRTVAYHRERGAVA